MDDVTKIVEETSAFKKEVMGHDFDKVAAHIQSLNSMVEELEESFDGREEIIMGVT
jgi:tetrahydromethanopterin S-methyltransferase subunit B